MKPAVPTVAMLQTATTVAAPTTTPLEDLTAGKRFLARKALQCAVNQAVNPLAGPLWAQVKLGSAPVQVNFLPTA